MASTSALLNKVLRRSVVPTLREAGFQHTDARNGWSWRDDFIWVFNIRAVGSYFSDCTGWPPGSLKSHFWRTQDGSKAGLIARIPPR